MKLKCVENRPAGIPDYQIFRHLDSLTGNFLDTLEKMNVKHAGKNLENCYYIDSDLIEPMITRITGITDR